MANPMNDNELNRAAAIARKYAASDAMPDVRHLAHTMLHLDAALDNVTIDLLASRRDNETLSESLDSAIKAGHQDRITVDYMRRALIQMFPHFADPAND